jgi:hypothetical protein
MRRERELAADCWYYVYTAVNNGEPLFLTEFGVWLLGWVLSEARLLFAFELRGVRFAGASVSFFIKPADGLQLPEIMKWIKQTCGYIWMTEGRGIYGAPKAAREACCLSPRQHGGPLIPALQTTRPMGPTGMSRGYWTASRLSGRRCMCLWR